MGLPPTASSGWVWKHFSAAAVTGVSAWVDHLPPLQGGLETFFGGGDIGVGLG